MAQIPDIKAGRQAFDRREWRTAYTRLDAADRRSPLEPADLDRFATAAYLVGNDAQAAAVWMRLHNLLVDRGEVARAARCGYWLSLNHLLSGDIAQSTGWLARSNRLLGDRWDACAEGGVGAIVTGLLAMAKDDPSAASAAFDRATSLASRHDDTDLLALGLLGQGQVLIETARISDGVARLDEAMVAVTAGDVAPIFAGIVYCAVILECQKIFDLRRAQEWTRALNEWCAAQPDLVPFRGRCLVHRSELLQLEGDWTGAIDEANRARSWLSGRSEAVVGRAHYQQGELHRLRGEFAQAEDMYGRAARYGCEPQPGIALLRLAQGRIDEAATAIRGTYRSGGGAAQARMLGALSEILLAAGDINGARAAADKLAQLAADLDAPYLAATAARAAGAVLLAEGDPAGSLDRLREAWTSWEELAVPYESARTQALLARLCRGLGDLDTARLRFDTARAIFRQLGAAPDLAAIEQWASSEGAVATAALTGREREILSHVAAGATNRQIAAALAISEHTVARHLSNIFDKLGVSSRTAASTFAQRSGLV